MATWVIWFLKSNGSVIFAIFDKQIFIKYIRYGLLLVSLQTAYHPFAPSYHNIGNNLQCLPPPGLEPNTIYTQHIAAVNRTLEMALPRGTLG